MREHEPKKPGGPSGHSRRDFLRGSGVAAATAVLTGQATLALDEAQAAQGEPKVLSGTVEITLKVNGQDRSCTVEPRSTLLDTLRHRLDVTGPKRVCDRGSCGACTAIVDGDPVYSCTTLAVSCQGKDDRDPGELRHRRAGRALRLPPERRPHVRLLHARLRHRRARRSWTRTPTRPSTRSTRGSMATSAAAALTSASCKRRSPRPKP